MPINYLQLQPQIQQYGQDARFFHDQNEQKLRTALQLLRRCAQGFPHNREEIISALTSSPGSPRSALPAEEAPDAVFDAPRGDDPYNLLTADGSQIVPDAHEALPIALINISLVHFRVGSGQAPVVKVKTEFLRDTGGRIEMQPIAEEQVNLERDVGELILLAEELPQSPQPLVALRDGALELFHEPRQSGAFDTAFRRYLDTLSTLYHKKVILAGYIDKPRANLVVSMLALTYQGAGMNDLEGLSDLHLFEKLLGAGQRSAIFGLQSSSSNHYRNELALHFFYLNAGSAEHPWIARVEIPAWVATDRQRVSLLQRALLEQCQLMGRRPYPYLLHRAHEEALVSQEEKGKLLERLALELQRRGLGLSQRSHKLSAKELPARARKKK